MPPVSSRICRHYELTPPINSSEHHADLVSCLGMAVVVAEVRGRFSQRIIAAARQDEHRERPRTGRKRVSNAARAVIEQRKEESRLEAAQKAGHLWSALGISPGTLGGY